MWLEMIMLFIIFSLNSCYISILTKSVVIGNSHISLLQGTFKILKKM